MFVPPGLPIRAGLAGASPLAGLPRPVQVGIQRLGAQVSVRSFFDAGRSVLAVTTPPQHAALVAPAVMSWVAPLHQNGVTLAVSPELATALPPGFALSELTAGPANGLVACVPKLVQRMTHWAAGATDSSGRSTFQSPAQKPGGVASLDVLKPAHLGGPEEALKLAQELSRPVQYVVPVDGEPMVRVMLPSGGAHSVQVKADGSFEYTGDGFARQSVDQALRAARELQRQVAIPAEGLVAHANGDVMVESSSMSLAQTAAQAHLAASELFRPISISTHLANRGVRATIDPTGAFELNAEPVSDASAASLAREADRDVYFRQQSGSWNVMTPENTLRFSRASGSATYLVPEGAIGLRPTLHNVRRLNPDATTVLQGAVPGLEFTPGRASVGVLSVDLQSGLRRPQRFVSARELGGDAYSGGAQVRAKVEGGSVDVFHNTFVGTSDRLATNLGAMHRAAAMLFQTLKTEVEGGAGLMQFSGDGQALWVRLHANGLGLDVSAAKEQLQAISNELGLVVHAEVGYGKQTFDLQPLATKQH